jgi:hypothetical protein
MGHSSSISIVPCKNYVDDFSNNIKNNVESVDTTFLHHPIVEYDDVFEEYIRTGQLKTEDLFFCKYYNWNDKTLPPLINGFESLNRITEIFKTVNYVKVFDISTKAYLSRDQYLYNGHNVTIPAGETGLAVDTDIWLRFSKNPLFGLQNAILQEYHFENKSYVIDKNIEVEFHYENFYQRHEREFLEILRLCKKAEQLNWFIMLS